MNTVSYNPIGGAAQTELLTGPLNQRPVSRDEEIREMSSAGQAREECDPGNPRSSRAFSDDRADLAHELANTITAVLINVQVLKWKLPRYSRLKRSLREIERNAQRGAELMKRLAGWLTVEEADQ
jgi:hypothetical protein